MTARERLSAASVDAAAYAARASTAEHVLILLPPLDMLAARAARAALALLAVACAPRRVNALSAAAPLDEHAEAAARFLERARSTTGQLLAYAA